MGADWKATGFQSRQRSSDLEDTRTDAGCWPASSRSRVLTVDGRLRQIGRAEATSVLGNLPTEGSKGDGLWFRATTPSGVQPVDGGHLAGGQLEVEDVNVLGDSA